MIPSCIVQLIRVDKISLQYAEGGSGLVSIPFPEYLYPSGADTTIFYSAFDGDVLIVKRVVNSSRVATVPAGVFMSNLSFSYRAAEEYYEESVQPGVGVLRTDITNLSRISFRQYWTRRTLTLLNYQLTR